MNASSGARGTSTPNFGSSKRESHDASIFYARFTAPEVSQDADVHAADVVDEIYHADARNIVDHVAANSVALVVTSPPYFAGKEYEEALGENGIPASYFEYLDMLRDVFAACKEVLEPGGRIAVNVANLGRKPYRSLSGDITAMLQDLGLLMRGEVIWWKGRAAGGSCAWGTFQRPNNPVLRDVTERVIIASKGRFDRALTPKQRTTRGLPSIATISRDEFLEATTDLWELAPASATSVGHPAPFPIELPQRLIELYTYEGDVVLDPFMGAGTTAMAAVRTQRRYLGFETDPAYIERANERIDETRAAIEAGREASEKVSIQLPATKPTVPTDGDDLQARALREGRQAPYLAKQILSDAGFVDIRTKVALRRLGIEIGLMATDATGSTWAFDISGGFTASRSGLRKSDTLWKALATASVLHQADAVDRLPFVLLSTDTPVRNSAGDKALRAVLGSGKPVHDVIELLDRAGQQRLAHYAQHGLD